MTKAFDNYLEIALGSTFEVVAESFLALDRNYISEEEQESLYESGEQLAKPINAFHSTLH